MKITDVTCLEDYDRRHHDERDPNTPDMFDRPGLDKSKIGPMTPKSLYKKLKRLWNGKTGPSGSNIYMILNNQMLRLIEIGTFSMGVEPGYYHDDTWERPFLRLIFKMGKGGRPRELNFSSKEDYHLRLQSDGRWELSWSDEHVD